MLETEMKTKYLFLIINHTSTHPMSGCPPHCTDPGTSCCCLAASATSLYLGHSVQGHRQAPRPSSPIQPLTSQSAASLSLLWPKDALQSLLWLLTPHIRALLCVDALLSSLGSDKPYGEGSFTHHTWVLTFCARVHEYTLTSLGMHPLISKVSSPNLDTFVTLLGL